MHLDKVTFTKKLKTNTPIPAKNVIPKYLNRNPKHMIRIKGRVATAGNYVDNLYILEASTCIKLIISPFEKVLFVAAETLVCF